MRRSLFLSINILALIIGISGCTQFDQVNPCDPGSPSFNPSTVSGRVINKVTKVLIEGVTVKLTGLPSGELAPIELSTQTDNSGKYVFPDIGPCRTYTITVSEAGEGYTPESKEITTEPGEVSEVDFEIVDTQNPSIIHDFTTVAARLNTKVDIFVSIADNDQVSKARLFYKPSGDDSFVESDLVKVGDDTFIGTIPAESVLSAGFDYYILAEDPSGNSATSETYHLIPQEGAILSLDKGLISVPVGGSDTIKVNALKEDGMTDSFTTISSNEAVATVSMVGDIITVTGLAKGKATIVVISGSGLTETVTVSVGEALIVEPTAIIVILGKSTVANAIATKKDGSPDTISVVSLDDTIANASVIGSTIKIEGVSVGETTVVVTSGEGATATIKVIVTGEGQPVLLLSKTSAIIPVVGGTEIIDITATKADGSEDTITFTSNNPSVATASLNGFTLTLNGLAIGSTTVKVESGSGLTESIQVTVGVPALLMDKAVLTVEVGQSDIINVTALDVNGDPDTVTAKISPSGIATVTVSSDSKNISITGVGVGNVTVTVTSGSGIIQTIEVTVNPSISLTNSTVVASPTFLGADGLSESTVTVTLMDGDNNLISGHRVTLSSGAHVTTITPSSVNTDTSGQATFTVKSSQSGVATITATDTDENVSLTNTASITFISSWTQTTYADFNSGATTGMYLTEYTDDVILDSDPATTGLGPKINLGIGSSPTDQVFASYLYRLPDGTFRMYYAYWGGSFYQLAYRTSADGISGWSPKIDMGIGSASNDSAETPFLYEFPDGTFRMYYAYWNGSFNQLSYRTSADGVSGWSNHTTLPIGTGPTDQAYSTFLYELPDGTFRLYYAFLDGTYWQISYKTSPDGVSGWTPKIDMEIGSSSSDHALFPFLYKLTDGTFRIYYEYQNASNFSQLSYRTSADGISDWSNRFDLGIGTGSNNQARASFLYKLSDGTFRMYYTYYDGSFYQLSYKTVPGVYLISGSLESSAYDTGAPSTFTTLSWNASTPAATSVKFQIRSASTQAGLSSTSWYGPTGTSDFYTTSGTAINSIQNGDRWVQYRAILDTSDTSVTPTLHDLTISYYNQ